MNEQEIYQKIGELLWSIMPQEAEIITFVGKNLSRYQGWGTSFILKDGSLSTFDFGENDDILPEIGQPYLLTKIPPKGQKTISRNPRVGTTFGTLNATEKPREQKDTVSK